METIILMSIETKWRKWLQISGENNCQVLVCSPNTLDWQCNSEANKKGQRRMYFYIFGCLCECKSLHVLTDMGWMHHDATYHWETAENILFTDGQSALFPLDIQITNTMVLEEVMQILKNCAQIYGKISEITLNNKAWSCPVSLNIFLSNFWQSLDYC